MLVRIELERQLSCSPEVAFALVSIPERVNLWAPVRTISLATGDGDHPGGVGALREVLFPGLARPLQEVVDVAEPPGRFEFREIGDAPGRGFESRIDLTPGSRGAHLRWRIDLGRQSTARSLKLRHRLEPELRSGLDSLARLASSAMPGDLPPSRRVDETVDLRSLYREAGAVLDDQRHIVYELMAAGDPKAWLARVHADVTSLQLDACRKGVFRHPGWVLRLIPRFHRYYVFNLERARGRSRAEDHWQRAFEAVQYPPRLLEGLRLALMAHVEADLPRALAETYVASYEDRCDYSRFRADFFTMGQVFEGIGPRLYRDLEGGALPVATRLARRVLPTRLGSRAFAQRFDGLMHRRVRAFEEGASLAKSLRGAAA